jgi:hypothetical protein
MIPVLLLLVVPRWWARCFFIRSGPCWEVASRYPAPPAAFPGASHRPPRVPPAAFISLFTQSPASPHMATCTITGEPCAGRTHPRLASVEILLAAAPLSFPRTTPASTFPVLWCRHPLHLTSRRACPGVEVRWPRDVFVDLPSAYCRI